MPENTQSRQVLTMEMTDSAASVSFGKRNGCFVKRGVAALLFLLFLGALVATGVLVYYFAPHPDPAAAHDRHEMRGDGVAAAGFGGLARGSERGGGDEKGDGGGEPETRINLRPEGTTEPGETGKSPGKTKVKDVRLPRALKPLHYLVRLQPFLGGNFTILGYVEVVVEVVEETSVFTLHMNDIISRNETVKVVDAEERDGEGVGIAKQTYDKDREFYHAHLRRPLTKGKRYKLTMEFQGYLGDGLHGFYRSSYKDDNGTERWLAVTQFQPTDARRAFPCFDEPDMKATFEVFLAREQTKRAISNMPKIKTTPDQHQEGWVWDQFNTTVPMPTYLVAFAVMDFESKEVTMDNGVDFRVWAREAAIQQANYSIEVGPATLAFFEEYFSIPYPLPKQDMIALPDFSAGAMENWGLITYRETAMLYDPMVSSVHNKQRVATVVVHELAHQWFGNLVTPVWWTDLWLNEGFASFMEFVGTNHVEPEWQMMEQFLETDLQSVFKLDCLESSHPISIPVGHPDEINEIFDRISYAKGASIIRMMNFFLTEATFRKGLTNYLTDRAYANAEQDDLWDFLTKAAHEDGTLPRDMTVKTIMDTWTLQMGYPVVKVTRSDDGTSATITQERFLLVKDPNSTDTHDYKWWVPLTYTSMSARDFNQTSPSKWLSPTESSLRLRSLPDNGEWVIFNLQETGYFRVNYDERNWKLLIRQLKEDHTLIHVNNRAQLVDDALNLARADQLSYSLALDVNTYLTKESSYTPWAAYLNNMDFIDKMLSRTGDYGALEEYLLTLLTPLYDSVGFEDSAADPHLDQIKRVKVLYWACHLGHQDCVDKSVRLYKKWMKKPESKSIISPNLKDVVYCTAIGKGGEMEWEFAWKQYLASNVASEKSKLLKALGCSKKIWMLSRYLEMAFTSDSGIRKQDSRQVFQSVAENSVGRDLAWIFLRDQWLNMTEYLGSGLFTLPYLIKSSTEAMNKELQLEELKLFQSTHEGKLGTAKRAMSQAVERTANNIAWMKNNYNVIVKWLRNNGYSSKLQGA
ncbi:aminopeptidase N-like [Eriocheir sinensis]|uniref:aminopeptidase N-like n=1 Tax=Eriocheir sinensis TaxID=95602 RepID=UPI0021CA3673|nr:aminopeptidase N-like [Eriocheir sinensis]